ncbi:MAG TPA: DsrE family protein [Tepidisphaeraceae bacterium]|nr:DsrE family protein [Tepidisphaeraceae bacterium]
MSRWMPTIIGLLVAISGGLWLAQRKAVIAADVKPAVKPHFIINLTSGYADRHRSTMALQLAKHAVDDGRNVVIFLNVRGPELAEKDSPEPGFRTNPPPNKMLADLMTRGVQVHACPACMEALSITKEAMLPGVILTDREKLFATLEAGATVFSY